MSARVALCIDEQTCRNPGFVGLEGESFEAQPWLDVYLSGEEARKGIAANKAIGEAWVVSSDDVEPINLAATLKSDHPDLHVRLVAFDGCGSLFSRAHTALIDEVADRALFLRCYAAMKRDYLGAEGAVEAVTELAPSVALPVEAPPLAADQVSPSTEVLSATQPVVALLPTAKAKRAFLMPVVSGSGGAGKSSVSVMAALIARSMGHRTLLLDYDLQFGDAALMAGVENALPLDEAMARPDRFERELHRDPGFAVLAAPSRLETAEDVVHATPQFLDDVSGAFDVIIANTGAAWAEQHAVLLERCSAALFLIDQRASSVRACRHALELCARCGIASGPFQFALNRCAKGAPLTPVDASSALQGAPVYEIRDGGRDVEDYLGGGAAAELLETRNEFCESLEHVMQNMLPGAVQRIEMPEDSKEGRRLSRRRGRHVGRKKGWGAS